MRASPEETPLTTPHPKHNNYNYNIMSNDFSDSDSLEYAVAPDLSGNRAGSTFDDAIDRFNNLQINDHFLRQCVVVNNGVNRERRRVWMDLVERFDNMVRVDNEGLRNQLAENAKKFIEGAIFPLLSLIDNMDPEDETTAEQLKSILNHLQHRVRVLSDDVSESEIFRLWEGNSFVKILLSVGQENVRRVYRSCLDVPQEVLNRPGTVANEVGYLCKTLLRRIREVCREGYFTFSHPEFDGTAKAKEKLGLAVLHKLFNPNFQAWVGEGHSPESFDDEFSRHVAQLQRAGALEEVLSGMHLAEDQMFKAARDSISSTHIAVTQIGPLVQNLSRIAEKFDRTLEYLNPVSAAEKLGDKISTTVSTAADDIISAIKSLYTLIATHFEIVGFAMLAIAAVYLRSHYPGAFADAICTAILCYAIYRAPIPCIIDAAYSLFDSKPRDEIGGGLVNTLVLMYSAMGIVSGHEDIAKQIAKFPSLQAGAQAWVNSLVDFAIWISKKVSQFTGWNCDLSQTLDETYSKWFNEVNILVGMAGRRELHPTIDNYNWLCELYKEGAEMYAIYSSRNGNPVLARSMNDFLPKVKQMLLDVSGAMNAFDGMHPQPVGVILVGGPGVGKSELAKFLSQLFIAAMGKYDQHVRKLLEDSPAELIWSKPGILDSDDFSAGYSNRTQVVLIDDIGKAQATCYEDNEWACIIPWINCVPTATAQAAVEDKGKVFMNHKMLICTTNSSHIDSQGMENVHAYSRRFPLVIKVENKDNLNAAALNGSHFSPDIYHLEKLSVNSSGVFAQQGPEITILQILNHIVCTYRSNEEFFNNTRSQFRTHVDRYMEALDNLASSRITTMLKCPTDKSIPLSAIWKMVKKHNEEKGFAFSRSDYVYPDGYPIDVGVWDRDLSFIRSQFQVPARDTFSDETKMDVLNGDFVHEGWAETFGEGEIRTILGGTKISGIYTIDVNRDGSPKTTLNDPKIPLTLSAKAQFEMELLNTEDLKALNLYWLNQIGSSIGVNWGASTAKKNATHIVIGFKSYNLEFFSNEIKMWLPHLTLKLGSVANAVRAHGPARAKLFMGFNLSPTDMMWELYQRFAHCPKKADCCDSWAHYIKCVPTRIGGVELEAWTKYVSSVAFWFSSLTKRVLISSSDAIFTLVSRAAALMPQFSWSGPVGSYLNECWETFKAGAASAVREIYRHVSALMKFMSENMKVIVGACTALSMAFAAFQFLKGNSENEFLDDFVDEMYGGPNKGYSKSKMKAAIRKRVQKHEPLKNEAHFSNSGESVIGVVRGNIYPLFFENDQVGFILGLYGKVFVIMQHFLHTVESYRKQGRVGDLHFTKDGIKVIIGKNTKELDSNVTADQAQHEVIGSFPSFANIVKHIANEGEFSKIVDSWRVDVSLIMPDERMVTTGIAEKTVVMKGRAGYTPAVAGMHNDQEGWRREECLAYNISTKSGYCGAPVIFGNKIVALHSAGYKGRVGIATKLTQESLSSVIIERENILTRGEFHDKHPDFDIPQLGLMLDEVCGFDASVCTGRLNLLSKPASIFTGEHEIPFEGFSLDFPKCTDVVVNTHPKLYSEARRGYNPDINLKVDEKMLQASVNAMGKFYEDLFRGMNLRSFTVKEVIEGIEEFGLKPHALNTSPGYPYSAEGLKTRDFFYRDDQGNMVYTDLFHKRLLPEISEATQALAYGHTPFLPFSASLKVETRSAEKVNKPRLIAGANLVHTIIGKMRFGPLVCAMKKTMERNTCLIGANEVRDWDYMERKFIEYGGNDRHGAGDYSGYDKNFTPEIIYAMHEAMEKAFGTFGAYGNSEKGRIDAAVRHAWIASCANALIVRGKVMEQWNASWPSGNFMTACGNSLVNELLFRYCFLKAYVRDKGSDVKEYSHIADMFDKAVYCKFLGDDNRFAVRKGFEFFNMHSLRDDLKDFGMVYTDAHKRTEFPALDHIDNVTILKRAAVYHRDIDRFMGAIELKSLISTAHFTAKGDPNGVCVQRLDGILRELSLHPKEVWDEYFPKFIDWYGPLAIDHRSQTWHMTRLRALEDPYTTDFYDF